ncbi:hypothetical protein BSG1_05015 [Bacillus sp. SG-1]|nr:hypothetical protein BSG1_05015 [Bacillus sp. SG-1]
MKMALFNRVITKRLSCTAVFQLLLKEDVSLGDLYMAAWRLVFKVISTLMATMLRGNGFYCPDLDTVTGTL